MIRTWRPAPGSPLTRMGGRMAEWKPNDSMARFIFARWDHMRPSVGADPEALAAMPATNSTEHSLNPR